MYCVGLTGTIASGKSTVLTAFAKLGAHIISADAIAKMLTQKETTPWHQIIEHFGHEFVKPNGEMDRAKLRQHIFQHPKDKQWLEDLLHPLIRQHIEQQIQDSHDSYCIIEIPLLKSKDAYPYLDRVLLVSSNPELQISRIIARDGCSYTQAKAILDAQEVNNTRTLIADDVLDNSTSLAILRDKVYQLHQRYCMSA